MTSTWLIPDDTAKAAAICISNWLVYGTGGTLAGMRRFLSGFFLQRPSVLKLTNRIYSYTCNQLSTAHWWYQVASVGVGFNTHGNRSQKQIQNKSKSDAHRGLPCGILLPRANSVAWIRSYNEGIHIGSSVAGSRFFRFVNLMCWGGGARRQTVKMC